MLESMALLTYVVSILQQSAPAIPPKAAAALAVGLAALGSGIAERGIGAAAVGAIAEDRDLFGIGLVMTVVPETLVILAIVVIFLV
ncbi:MAG: F0F1 ATP synthase subunit C [Halobacteriales archaeon]